MFLGNAIYRHWPGWSANEVLLEGAESNPASAKIIPTEAFENLRPTQARRSATLCRLLSSATTRP